MGTQTAVKAAIGVLVIGGTFAALWAVYRPSLPTTTPVEPPRRVPLLHDAYAVIRLEGGTIDSHRRRATVTCVGRRRRATGFWAASPAEACDALASTRTALLSGRRCRRVSAGRVRLIARGAFGRRRFDHVQQQGGCPVIDGWLAVNVLAKPVLVPQQELTEREPRTQAP